MFQIIHQIIPQCFWSYFLIFTLITLFLILCFCHLYISIHSLNYLLFTDVDTSGYSSEAIIELLQEMVEFYENLRSELGLVSVLLIIIMMVSMQG